MKYGVWLLILTVCLPLYAGTTADSNTETETKNTQEEMSRKAAYALGARMGQQLKRQGISRQDLDPESFGRGIRDALEGQKLRYTRQERYTAISTLQKSITKRVQRKRRAEAPKNQAAGEAFLRRNAKRKEVVTTDSGLQYEVIKKGTGDIPKKQDFVKVHYRGRFIDGKEFDSSYKNKKPAILPIRRVIKGWTEALLTMNVGAHYRLYIPPKLAYGKRGSGKIGPQQTLIFDIKLLGIIPADREKKTEDGSGT